MWNATYDCSRDNVFSRLVKVKDLLFFEKLSVFFEKLSVFFEKLSVFFEKLSIVFQKNYLYFLGDDPYTKIIND